MYQSNISIIDKIIRNKQKYSPQQILILLLNNQEDLINDLKLQKSLVCQFFTKNASFILSTLIEYITVVSSNPDDVDRGYEYPLIAHDIFECKPHMLMSLFYSQKIYLK